MVAQSPYDQDVMGSIPDINTSFSCEQAILMLMVLGLLEN